MTARIFETEKRVVILLGCALSRLRFANRAYRKQAV
jgi:hypothetical protein